MVHYKHVMKHNWLQYNPVQQRICKYGPAYHFVKERYNVVQAYLKHHIAEGGVWIKVIPLAKVIESKGNTSIAFVTEAHLPYGIENMYI